ncbi:MAG TPA: CHAT domain-containing protein, partial [Myxococcales bacterium]|nr:CHAT domain-containing protein [Myxococcales bacterium]
KADRELIERTEQKLNALAKNVHGAVEGNPQSASEAKASVDDAIRLARELRDASRDVEPIRTKVYDLARAGTPSQRELLVPLAEVLDGPGSALVRRLSAPGPSSAAHQRLVALSQRRDGMKWPELESLARELEQAGEEELLLGLLGLDPKTKGMSELPVSDDLLKKLQRQEPYVAVRATRYLARRALARGDKAQAFQLLEEAARRCEPGQNPERCAMVDVQRAWTDISAEQWSEAQSHQQRGLLLAQRIPASWARPTFLTGMADAASAQNDPWLALAYAEEARRMLKPCDPLYRRLLQRMAAVRLHFFVDSPEALELLRQAVKPQGCDEAGLTMTGLHVFASLVSMGIAPPDLQPQLHQMFQSADEEGKRQPIVEYWRALSIMAESPAKGRDMLEDLVSETEGPQGGFPLDQVVQERAKTHYWAYRELALEAGAAASAGARTGYARAFEMVARQLSLKPPEICALAVVSNLGRTVAVAKDERGIMTGDFRKTGWRWVDRRGDLVVPAEVQGALRGCRHVQVLASPGVFGLSRLLSNVPWSYAVKQQHVPRDRAPARRLVVANTEPPSGLKLERISPLATGAQEAGMVALQHRTATLSNVKRELEAATEVELYTHGIQKPNDAEGSYLVLTPDPASGGEFRLTGRDVQSLKLDGAPLVFLEACVTADAGFQNHEARSLASAFVERGARATFASTVSIPDVDANRFFDAVRERTGRGLAPAEALFEARAAFKKDGRFQEWMDDVVCLEAA